MVAISRMDTMMTPKLMKFSTDLLQEHQGGCPFELATCGCYIGYIV
jgi:hypothetical protein